MTLMKRILTFVLLVGGFILSGPALSGAHDDTPQAPANVGETRGLEHVQPGRLVARFNEIPEGVQVYVGAPPESSPEERAKKLLEDEEWKRKWKEFNEKLEELENVLKDYGLDVA